MHAPCEIHREGPGRKLLGFSGAGAASEGRGQMQRRQAQLRRLLTATRAQDPTAQIFLSGMFRAFMNLQSYR